MHVNRLVSKDGPHVRHPLPAPASHSVLGYTPAVLASSRSWYYGTRRRKVQGKGPHRTVQPVAPRGDGAIRCTSPSIFAVGDSE